MPMWSRETALSVSGKTGTVYGMYGVGWSKRRKPLRFETSVAEHLRLAKNQSRHRQPVS